MDKEREREREREREGGRERKLKRDSLMMEAAEVAWIAKIT